MRRISTSALADAIAAAAAHRLDVAAARQAVADALILALPGEHHPGRGTTYSVAQVYSPAPGLAEASIGWLLAWWLDGLSRIELALARSIARDHELDGTRDRPAARARDGPA